MTRTILVLALWGLPLAAHATEPSLRHRTVAHEVRNNRLAEAPTIRVLTYNTALSCGVGSGHSNCTGRARSIRDAILTRFTPFGLEQPDVLIFTEGFSGSPAPNVLGDVPEMQRDLKPPSYGGTTARGLSGLYPYFTSVLRNTEAVDLTSGGVWIQSRWPIENGPCANDQQGYRQCDGEHIVFGDESYYGVTPFPNTGDCPTHWTDSIAAKGVKYARIRHPSGRRIHVFGTHLQADYGSNGEHASDRACQLNTIANFILQKNVPIDETVIVGGDLNFSGVAAEAPIEHARLAAWSLLIPNWSWGWNGFPFSYDSQTNNYWSSPADYEPVARVGLDHIMFGASHRQPRTIDNYVHSIRLSSADLSDHHAVVAQIDIDYPAATSPKPMRTVFNPALGRLEMTSSVWPSVTVPDYATLLSGDFDDDQRTDILIPSVPPSGDDTNATVKVKRASQTTWTNFATGKTFGRHDIFVAGNFDGVGGTDLARIAVNPNTTTPTAQNVDIGRSTGTSFNFDNHNGSTNPWASWLTHPGMVILAAELNDDARTDLVKIERGGDIWGAVSRHDATSNQGTFHTTKWTNGLAFDPDQHIALPGDFDGNGKTDIAIIRIQSSTAFGVLNEPIRVFRNTASTGSLTGSFVQDGTQAGGAWITGQTFNPAFKYLVADLNADGRSDIVVIESSGAGTNDSMRRWGAYISVGPTGGAGGRFVFDPLGRTTNFMDAKYATARSDKFLVGQFDGVAGDDILQIRVALDNSPGAFGNMYFVPALSRPFSSTDIDLAIASTAIFGFHYDTTQEMHLLTGDFDGDGTTDTVAFHPH